MPRRKAVPRPQDSLLRRQSILLLRSDKVNARRESLLLCLNLTSNFRALKSLDTTAKRKIQWMETISHASWHSRLINARAMANFLSASAMSYQSAKAKLVSQFKHSSFKTLMMKIRFTRETALRSWPAIIQILLDICTAWESQRVPRSNNDRRFEWEHLYFSGRYHLDFALAQPREILEGTDQKYVLQSTKRIVKIFKWSMLF